MYKSLLLPMISKIIMQISEHNRLNYATSANFAGVF